MPFTDARHSLNLWQLWNILQTIPPSVVKGDIDRDSGSVFYNYLIGSWSWAVQANRPRQRRALHQEIHMPFECSVEVGWGVHSLMMNIYSKASVAKVLAKNPVQLRCLLEHKKVLWAWGDHGPSDFKTVWMNLGRLESIAACKILAVTCLYQRLRAIKYMKRLENTTLPVLLALHMN